MNITYSEKPVQQERTLGRNANSWPKESDSVWRVTKSDHADFLAGDLLLYLCSNYQGYAFINMRSKTIHTNEVTDGNKVSIIQDFTLNAVTLYVDNSARP
jgi:hypothetical protein